MANKIVQLKHGLKIGEQTYMEVEIREPNVGDLIDAEAEAPTTRYIAWRIALIERCIVRVGDYSGIITSGILRRLKPADYNILNNALLELSNEGED